MASEDREAGWRVGLIDATTMDPVSIGANACPVRQQCEQWTFKLCLRGVLPTIHTQSSRKPYVYCQSSQGCCEVYLRCMSPYVHLICPPVWDSQNNGTALGEQSE